MEREKRIHGRFVERVFVRTAGDRPRIEIIAKVLHQGETMIGISGNYFGGRKASVSKCLRHLQKGVQVGPGEPGHCVVTQVFSGLRRGVDGTSRAL